MKKLLFLLAICILFFAGCAPEEEPSLTATDFTLQLVAQTTFNAGDLAELISLTRGMRKADLEAVSGWEAAEHLGQEALGRTVLVDSRPVNIKITFGRDGTVGSVHYSHERSANDDLMYYAEYDDIAEIKSMQRLMLVVENNVTFSTEEEMYAALREAIENEEDLHFNYRWIYTNSVEDELEISFSFTLTFKHPHVYAFSVFSHR